MKAAEKTALILAFWMGLSGIWFASSAWAQWDELEEAKRLYDQAGRLYAQGKDAETVPLIQKALELREKVLGPEHQKVAETLNDLGILYQEMGNYAAAEPLLKRALLIWEKKLGPEHKMVNERLNNLATLYASMGNFTAAEPLFKRCLTIAEKTLGSEHPDTMKIKRALAALEQSAEKTASLDLEEADRLHDQVMELFHQGKYAEALQSAQQVLSITEKVLGPEHPHLPTVLSNTAELHRRIGNFAEAEPLHKRSLAIREKTLGLEHPDVASNLNNLAALYHSKGNYVAAEPLYKRSLAISEKVLGSEHPDVATKLNNLALLYHSMGNFAEAEPLYKRSLSIREVALGLEHPDVAQSLNNIGGLYKNMGDYAAAELLLKRSLRIKENKLDPEHPDVATGLNNLAWFYREMGNYAEAEPLFKRSLVIVEKTLGSNHPNVATGLNNLADLYYAKGNFAEAEKLFKRSLSIREEALGPEHPDVAESLNNLAGLYHSMGNFAPAETLNKRSLSIREEALGPEHPDVAQSLNNLALLYKDMGNYAEAELLYKGSLSIWEKALGSAHPATALSLKNLAILKARLGNSQQSFELMLRAQAIGEATAEQVAGFTSGERTMQFLATTQGNIDVCLSLVSSLMREDFAARKEAFGVWLRRKGVVLEAQRRMQQALIEAGDYEAAKAFEELSQTRARLAELTFAGPGKEKFEIYQKMLKELSIQKDELESKLSRLSQAYAQARKARKVTVEDVAKALPPDDALVDVARVDVFNFEAKGNEKKWLPAHYLAFVLRSGQGQDVALLDLGLADEIDTALNMFKSALTQKQETKARDLSRKLHDMVFAPVQKELGGAQRVFLSPDGALNLLPFEVLRDPEDKYLIENYTFNYLAAGRDIVGFSEKKVSAEKPVLLGDPDFDLDPNKKNQVLNRLGIWADTAVAAVRSVEKLSLPFERLKETGEEVNTIGDLLGRGQCEVFLESSALEEVLQSRRAPRILHLATHGFFLEDQQWSAMGDFRGIGGTDSFMSMEQPFARPFGPKVNQENPLLRSGIALAGANRAGSSGQGSNGILTADEVLGLRLRGTELVVLSACETGLGEVKTGEGVFGLRRAFAQAGARSLVMSMWKVPDAPTKDLMVEFYRNILSSKLDRCQSLRQAALKMKQKYGDNPFFWGAFVFLGQAE